MSSLVCLEKIKTRTKKKKKEKNTKLLHERITRVCDCRRDNIYVERETRTGNTRGSIVIDCSQRRSVSHRTVGLESDDFATLFYFFPPFFLATSAANSTSSYIPTNTRALSLPRANDCVGLLLVASPYIRANAYIPRRC